MTGWLVFFLRGRDGDSDDDDGDDEVHGQRKRRLYTCSSSPREKAECSVQGDVGDKVDTNQKRSKVRWSQGRAFGGLMDDRRRR